MTPQPTDDETLTARLDAYRRQPIPCGHTIATVRDGHHVCTHPAGHIGLHRDPAGCSWGDTDA